VPIILCDESLLLDQAQMEEVWYDWDKRTLEVMRTVSLASVLKNSKLTATPTVSGLAGILTCDINLAELNIPDDYPPNLGYIRRIKNISVFLPALVGPYQNIQAVLSYICRPGAR